MNTSDDNYIRECLAGRKLFGDDFSYSDIEKWFQEEKEGYADLYAHEGVETEYPYNAINTVHCFNHTGNKDLDRVLSIGGAYCEELVPVANRIKNITVLEPSDQLTAESLLGIPLHYVKPSISGVMPFDDDTFDMVTCFGVLHHIPNVSFVMAEIKRILKPGGLFLFREPIVSMGDWTKSRPGLTKNERGIPKLYLDRIIHELNFNVVNYSFCFTKPFDILIGRLFKINVYNSIRFAWVDKILGSLFYLNYVYHPTTISSKVRPSCVAVVLKK